MNAVLPALVPEFETRAQESSYTAWLRAKVEASLADSRAAIPHDQVMAEMDSIIEEQEQSPAMHDGA